MRPNLDCRVGAIPTGQNFQPGSPVSQLLCMQKQYYHGEEVDLGFRSWTTRSPGIKGLRKTMVDILVRVYRATIFEGSSCQHCEPCANL